MFKVRYKGDQWSPPVTKCSSTDTTKQKLWGVALGGKLWKDENYGNSTKRRTYFKVQGCKCCWSIAW